MLGIEITQQALFYGVVYGLIYAVFAAGFVLVYRCTGILNFAQGEIGAFGVAIFALFHVQYGVPYWLAFVSAVVATALIGMVVELSVVRRLFSGPRLVLLIATVGVAQLLLFLRISLPQISAGGGFPLPFTGRWRPTGSLMVLPREILVLVVAPVVIMALALFMTRTSFGLAVRASASNADTARVYGISVKRTSTIVWTIAGRVRGRDRDPHRAAARGHAGQHRLRRRGRDRPVAVAACARGRAHRPHAISADDDRRRDRGGCVRTHRPRQRRRSQPVDRRPLSRSSPRSSSWCS